MKHASIIAKMTLEDKVALCSGAASFITKAFEQYDIPAMIMADGPHGLRKQLAAADHLGINDSVPATSFPTARLTACSWDRELLREMGEAIAREALEGSVAVVLGPGVNIKRNPLCGRNFEYFSEDPYLSGEMGAAWIDGLQKTGVGASLKHYAGNSQENERMASDSLMDERTLREIYLPAFEKAVKAAKPRTVMCAYNKVNGIYCSDHVELMRNILRDEWGFEGVIVTDWGAMNDRVQAFEAGVDLEMPSSQGFFDDEIIQAVRDGKLAEARLDESVDRVLELILSADASMPKAFSFDRETHHQLAKKIAAQSAVLLKNEDNLLPISQGKQIALIGGLAKEPRYQGAGSSHINPTRLSNAIEGFEAVGLSFTYYQGYPLKGDSDEALLEEAVAGAKDADVAVVFAGLPEEYESEGFDRDTMTMPDSHNALIARVAAANPNTVVVLVGGAPVEMPWLPAVKGVLNIYLSGQAGGLAAAELLSGRANPSGKLAETYPLRYADVPSAGVYEKGTKQAQYREALYVGYRYFDKAGKEVLFPFGYGLSYTSFEYSDLSISSQNVQAPYDLTVMATIRNTGALDGAEVAQLYVAMKQDALFRPDKELKGFEKVFLKAGESKQVTFTLDARSFAIYDPSSKAWVVPEGVYTLEVGASSRDIRQSVEVSVQGEPNVAALREAPGWYRNLRGAVTQADFEQLMGKPVEPVAIPPKGLYTMECSLRDMQGSFVARAMIRWLEGNFSKAFGGVDYKNPTFRMMMESATGTPIRRLVQLAPESMPKHLAAGIVHLANGRIWRGLVTLISKKA